MYTEFEISRRDRSLFTAKGMGALFSKGVGALFFSGTSLGVPQKSSMMRFEAKFVESAAGILGVTKTPSAADAARMEISLLYVVVTNTNT